MGELSKLEKVSESGELECKTRGEAKESFTQENYGGIFSLSRKAIVTDDLGAFRDWGIAVFSGHGLNDVRAILDAHFLYRDHARQFESSKGEQHLSTERPTVLRASNLDSEKV